MKLKVLLLSLILGIVAAFFLFGTASATESVEVIPRVNVVSGGSLSIVSGTTKVGDNDVIEFGDMGPGTTQGKTLALGITANGDWQVTVNKTGAPDGSQKDLEDGSHNIIPSANFTFTSSAGTPAPPGTPTYVSNTQFGTDTNVVTNGEAADGCQVKVTYKLVIPADQPAGTYYARHTYTLIVP